MTGVRFNASRMTIALILLVTLSSVRAQSANCVSEQQHADTEARIAAMTQGFDPGKIGHDLSDTFQQRIDALDAVKKCQGAVLSIGCGQEIDLYNLADVQYQNAAQALDVYTTLVFSQATARSQEAPVCPATQINPQSQPVPLPVGRSGQTGG